MSIAVHMATQINFRDLTPYLSLTYAFNRRFPYLHAAHETAGYLVNYNLLIAKLVCPKTICGICWT
jgi:hypothetical protein